MKKVFIVLAVLIVLALVGLGVWQWIGGKKEQGQQRQLSPVSTSSTGEVKTLDPIKEASHLSHIPGESDTYWVRGGLDLIWNEIESTKGQYDWSFTDEALTKMSKEEVYYVALVQPFANWDQDSCHPEAKYQATNWPSGSLKVGKPCDMTAYAEFLAQAVERYDGNGIEDMPGLQIPIKYWEIMNEPSMQGGVTGGMGEELKFFVGTPEDYFEILKISYQTIKKADPEAKVLHAGMAGMQKEAVDFFAPIFTQEGGKYFDIANNHTISTDERREDLSMIKFKKLLTEKGLEDKPVWITEVQFGSLTKQPTDLGKFEKLLAKASVFSLAKGADKLFYITNWLEWGRDYQDKKPDKDDWKRVEQNKQTSTHKVYRNLVKMVNDFDKAETIKEEYILSKEDSQGATSTIGQYKFVKGDKTVYVLWGQADLPTEITGRVKVTDIYGQSQEMETKDLQLTDSLIFVELD